MFAVIETGGKQYQVSVGQKIEVEKLDVEVGANLTLDKVLLVVEGENVKVGAPYVSGAKVETKVINQARDDKKIVFKYHSKTRRRKKNTHRQFFTELEIVSIK